MKGNTVCSAYVTAYARTELDKCIRSCLEQNIRIAYTDTGKNLNYANKFQ